MRDLKATADKARINMPDRYDLSFSELFQLVEEADTDREHRIQALITAFRAGFTLGNRATIAGAITKKL